MRTLSESDSAWLAGLLEGEGHFKLARKGGRKYLSMSCAMTDADVIQRILDVTGVGNIRTPRLLPNRKQIYTWDTGRCSDVVAICHAIRPYMGARRGARIDEMLQYAKENPLRPQSPWRHGTLNCYTNHCCRCEPCREAAKTYRRQYAERNRAA